MNKENTLLDFTDQTLSTLKEGHMGTSGAEILLNIPSWALNVGERWAVIGGTDRQRQAICRLLRDDLLQTRYEFKEVSAELQASIVDEEDNNAKTGLADQIVTGTSVEQFLNSASRSQLDGAQHRESLQRLVTLFDFHSCMSKRFRELSSGETRRALLISALATPSDCYLFHDPYEGLDRDSLSLAKSEVEAQLAAPIRETQATSRLTTLRPPTVDTAIFVATRWRELPSAITHIAHIDGDTLSTLTIEPLDPKRSLQNILQSLAPTENSSPSIPRLPNGHPFLDSPSPDPKKPLVALTDAQVSYADVEAPIFSQVNLRIGHLEHTQITGKNGSGKSTLLKLITGDHPQVYKNKVEICGLKRGSGESVWQVKRFIGHMSSETFWRYRGSGQLAGKAIDVVVSGLYDSVGLYTKPTAADLDCARQWLTLFAIEDRASVRFQRLSLAEQRLVLVARAMIKRPALLILDEPCIGLDIEDRRQVLSVIEALIRAKACTVLYVSHHDDERISGIQKSYSLSR